MVDQVAGRLRARHLRVEFLKHLNRESQVHRIQKIEGDARLAFFAEVRQRAGACGSGEEVDWCEFLEEALRRVIGGNPVRMDTLALTRSGALSRTRTERITHPNRAVLLAVIQVFAI